MISAEERKLRAASAAADTLMARALARDPAVAARLRAPDRIRPNDTGIAIGRSEQGNDVIGIDPAKLMAGRLLVQGTSGAGKSWTLRRLLEQTAFSIQHIVIDPEGEFRNLAQQCEHLLVDAHRLDAATIAALGARIREHRLSTVLDLSELDREAQMIAVAALLESLIAAPREHWHPAIVAIDEAHLFAPFGGQTLGAPEVRKAAIGAVVDLMTRGRKRGLCGIIATQRLARLSKSVASEVINFLIGQNTLDLDIRRAAETIGWDARRAFDRLPMLEPGDFVAVGPAFSRSPAALRVGAVLTSHAGEAPALAAPARVGAANAAAMVDLGALEEQTAAEQAIRDSAASPGTKAVRAFIRDASFPAAGRAWEALLDLAPEGARVAALFEHLGLDAAAGAGALALLDTVGMLEFMGEDDARAVRIARQFVRAR